MDLMLNLPFLLSHWICSRGLWGSFISCMSVHLCAKFGSFSMSSILKSVFLEKIWLYKWNSISYSPLWVWDLNWIGRDEEVSCRMIAHWQWNDSVPHCISEQPNCTLDCLWQTTGYEGPSEIVYFRWACLAQRDECQQNAQQSLLPVCLGLGW